MRSVCADEFCPGLPGPFAVFWKTVWNGSLKHTADRRGSICAIKTQCCLFCFICAAFAIHTARLSHCLINWTLAAAAERKQFACLPYIPAKGLEYDAVFVIDAVMGEFPGNGAVTGKLLEEELPGFFMWR